MTLRLGVADRDYRLLTCMQQIKKQCTPTGSVLRVTSMQLGSVIVRSLQNATRKSIVQEGSKTQGVIPRFYTAFLDY